MPWTEATMKQRGWPRKYSNWQDLNPLVALAGPETKDGGALRLTPARDLLSQPPYNEAREGWTYFSLPLAGGETGRRR
jgi:hypothetical protein